MKAKKIRLLLMLLIFHVAIPAQGHFIKICNTNGYKFEIPDYVIGKDILFGSRIVDISKPEAKVYAAGQMRKPPVIIRFTKSGNTLRMDQIINFYKIDKNDPIYESVEKNQRVSAVYTFDIEQKVRKDGSLVNVIDVSKFFLDEVTIAWPLPDNVNNGRLDSKLTSVLFMKELDDHVNIRVYYGYTGGKEPFSITVQYFMLLLPELLKPRYDDDRVGYQTISLKKYESGKVISKEKIISRWRIEPKLSDVEKHRKGQLVEPENPIVIFIDPAFPSDWIPYIKMGIEDWQKAFEKIGFKNAIIAKEYPKNDTDFDPYDIRVNCVRYIPVQEANASGQIWIDPRSGEILQGDILWWNDVISLIKMWRFTQTAAVDPEVRRPFFSKEIEGELIRYAIAHETGHMLGLQHNMRASYAYPVDSLRSPTFTMKFGTTASIMDYARNNYVAQPGDLQRGVKMTPPALGPFDFLSIEYGYKIIYGADTEKKEREELEKIFISKGDDPMYFFGPLTMSQVFPDPASQSDALGDDIIKSSYYGIKNTRIILENLYKWTIDTGGDESLLVERYNALINQYYRLLSLPLSYVGGKYQFYGNLLAEKPKYIPVEKQKQIEAVNYITLELKEAGKHTLRRELLPLIGSEYVDKVYKKEADLVALMVSPIILTRLVQSSFFDSSCLSIEEYLDMIDDNILNLSDDYNNPFVKNIQTSYIQALISVYKQQGGETITGTNSIILESILNRIIKTKSKLTNFTNKQSGDSKYLDYLLSLLKTDK